MCSLCSFLCFTTRAPRTLVGNSLKFGATLRAPVKGQTTWRALPSVLCEPSYLNNTRGDTVFIQPRGERAAKREYVSRSRWVVRGAVRKASGTIPFTAFRQSSRNMSLCCTPRPKSTTTRTNPRTPIGSCFASLAIRMASRGWRSLQSQVNDGRELILPDQGP